MERYEDPDRIHSYSYQADNKSILDRLFLNRWYGFAFRILPLRMSANLVSMMGNLGSWFAFALLSGLIFGPLPDVAGQKPWIFALAALGLEYYQTFDALDGLQARRLGTSGPLGEFIDHWFDSLNVFILPFGACLAFPGVPPALALGLVLLATLTDWIELRRVKETNTLDFGILSSEEATFCSCIFYLSISIVGYAFWSTPLPGLGLSPILLILTAGALGLLTTGALSLARYGFAWLPDLLAEILSLLPLALGVLVLQAREGRTWLILGGLCLGFTGSRIVSELLRNRLMGLTTRRWHADILVLDAVLIVALFLPGLPPWVAPLALLVYLGWDLAMLALQFRRTLGRVKEKLGIGLFHLPPALPGTPTLAPAKAAAKTGEAS